MLANILILAFVLAMIYWWGLQGFFSGFMHLMITIIAGAMAFALWEPLVYAFGMKMQPAYAWGLWLLGPFVLMLIVFRVAADRLVRKSVQFPALVSNILGGVCGFLSGVLTAGMAVIGLGFLPLGPSLAGYEPFQVSGGGQVMRTGTGLWIPVDSMTGGFFATLGYNGFYTDTPLPDYQPNIADQAALYRVRYDLNSSVVAVPGSVDVTAAAAAPLPLAELDAKAAIPLAEASGGRMNGGGQQLVVVDTTWRVAPGTFDGDSAVRIPPTQIRLVTMQSGLDGGAPQMHAPIGFSHRVGDSRILTPLRETQQAFGNGQQETFGWIFVVPADQQPKFLLARHTRLTLPDVKRDAALTASMVGAPAEAAPADAAAGGTTPPTDPGGTTGVGGREGIMAGNAAEEIALTADLPREISTNFAQGLTVTDGAIQEGSTTASKPPASISRNTRIDRVLVPAHQGAVRVKITPDRARSLLGGARVSAASLGGVWLTDNQGEKWLPIAYVWLKSGGEQQIRVDRLQQIRSARELPVHEMQGGDELYLYFAVPKGRSIVSYSVGDNMTQQLEPPRVVQ